MAIEIFEKNKIDLDREGITITATDGTVGVDAGQDFVDFLRNRRNDNGWGTGGSSDAGLTTLVIESTDEMSITDAHLVGMNFAAYTLQYWNGSAYVDFSTAVNVSGNTATTKSHAFTEVSTLAVKLIVSATMVADADKLMAQLILTKRMGTFTTEPYVKKPRHERGRKIRKMLSGRSNVTRTSGAFSATLSFPAMTDATDWALIESMFDSFEGFLIRLCGGSTSSFFTSVQGWRLQDFYLVTCANDLETEWNNGRFAHGQKVDVQLVESRI